MYWLVVMASLNYNGGIAMNKVDKYGDQKACEAAGVTYISQAKSLDKDFSAPRLTYMCVPAPVN